MLSALPGGLLGARHGTAPATVVALHGWRRTSVDFDAVLAGLDAVAPDLPGFGVTPPPPEVWGAEDYANACADLCEQPAVVVGHSMGGRIAVMMAAANPDRVKALVLTGAPLIRPPGQAAPKPSLAHRIARTLNKAGVISDDRMEARRREAGSDDYRNATGVMRGILVKAIRETDDGTYARVLERISCPVTLVWGERDTAAPPAVATAIAAALPRPATVTILDGVGHLTPSEAPAALRSAIERYL